MAVIVSELEATARLRHVLDRVSVGHEDVMIERPGAEPVVLVALDDYIVLTEALTVVADGWEPALHAVRGPGASVHSLDAQRRRRAAH